SSSLALLWGLIYSAFPAGVFAFPSNQQLEATLNITYIHHTNEKIRTMNRSDLPSTKIRLYQPLFN
ncbi:hypothetical protein MOF27_15960, partial [Priestia megaterium]|uniref:hypothetical protein n=1 Tax=Priestia megaterium TaxID=1404 RepID=UPI00228259AD